MKTLINLPDDQIKALDKIAKTQMTPRTKIVQEAVNLYLEQKLRSEDGSLPGFGSWKIKKREGVEYQRKLRKEWDL